MTTSMFPARERGHANHGWLDSYHTFSFASYFNPNRVRFGMLRVFNDDTVTPGAGFGTHPHDNMEIISIPLEGVINHKDSMNNVRGLSTGDIQIMSAGTGLTHSEYNGSETDVLKFLQIWIFPNERDVEPRYAETHIGELPRNVINTVIGPKSTTEAPLWMHQRAWLSLARIDAGTTVMYSSHDTQNGVFVFVIEGEVSTANEQLGRRDAIGVTDSNEVSVTATASSYLVIIEVPMS